MLTQVVMNSLQQAEARTPAVMLPAMPQAGENDTALTRFAERVQGSLENMTVPIGVLFDSTRRQPISTAEMLRLQAAIGEYSATILTLSHIAQSVGSTVQSLVQRS